MCASRVGEGYDDVRGRKCGRCGRVASSQTWNPRRKSVSRGNPDEAMNADGPAAAEVPAAAVPKNAGGSTQSGSTPVADEEANLLLTSEAPESGVSCLNVTRIVLALPFIFAGMVGIMFFWLLWVLLLPIEHCCQCGQQPCLAGTREWLDKGARLPLALLKWATQ